MTNITIYSKYQFNVIFMGLNHELIWIAWSYGFWTIKDIGNTSVDWWFCGLLGVLVDYCSGNPLIGDTYQPTTMGGDTKYEHFAWLRCCQKLQMGCSFDEKLAVLGREFDQFSCLIYNSICWWYCKQLVFVGCLSALYCFKYDSMY
jgi:hypothetical protein